MNGGPRRAGAVALAPLLLVACAPLGGEEGRPPGLPGAPPFHQDLRTELAAARESKGPGYRPRTRHLAPDGSALYTNRLLLETSPYLLQHAHNPVSWYPWGDEAFDRAREQARPVLLSVGYSTCHWCHVMEEESFEDEAIARFMNEKYVAIKVDREERPDVGKRGTSSPGHRRRSRTRWARSKHAQCPRTTASPRRGASRGGAS